MDAEISVRRHPPERRPTSGTVLFSGCCCCCCCCVHSLGSLAGAILGGRRKDRPEPGTLTTEPEILKEAEVEYSHKYAIRVYWLALTLCAFFTCAVSVIAEPNDKIIGPFIVIGFLPIGQLAASLFSLIFINVRPPVKKDVALRRLGKITLWSFLGTVIGCIGTALTFTLFK